MFDSSATGAMMIFILTIALSAIGLMGAPQLIERSLFRPYWFLRKQQYDTVIMSGFMHADFGHLFFNMLTFYFFSFALEHQIGTLKFIALYLIALLLSALGTFLKQRNNPDYATLGASGAVSAVLFAYIVYFPTQKLFFLLLPIPIPAPLFAVGYLAYTYFSARYEHGRINHDAHMGGAITGLVFVAFTDWRAYEGLLSYLQ